MCWNERVYFASDRDGMMNIWSMDRDGRDLRQHTHQDGCDVQSPSLSDGRIAFQLGADLHSTTCRDRDSDRRRSRSPRTSTRCASGGSRKPID